MSIKQAAKRVAEDVAVDAVCGTYEACYENLTLTEPAIASIKRFYKYLTVTELCEAMDIACERIGDQEQVGNSQVFRYFCGICWQQIRGPKARESPTNQRITD